MHALSVELRAEVTGNKVSGVAAVFDQLADLGQKGYEGLARSAFDDVLKKAPDVRTLVNHEPGQLLARTGNGSLRLRKASEGLAYDFDLPDTTLGRDVREMVDQGLLNQMSFAFIPGKSTRSEAPDGRQVRTHTSIADLLDISLVTYPAYAGTSAELRHIVFPARPIPRRRIAARSRLLLTQNGAPHDA